MHRSKRRSASSTICERSRNIRSAASVRNKLRCFGIDLPKPAGQVTDPERSNGSHAWVGRGATETDTPALDKRSILVMQAERDERWVRVRLCGLSFQGLPQDRFAGCIVDTKWLVVRHSANAKRPRPECRPDGPGGPSDPVRGSLLAMRSSHHADASTREGSLAMIRMTYECPETHEPLPSMSTAVWMASDDTAVLVMCHCPKCSKRHAFSRADAILAVDAPVGERDGRSSASSDLTRARPRDLSPRPWPRAGRWRLTPGRRRPTGTGG
jgi:hypothetical protein